MSANPSEMSQLLLSLKSVSLLIEHLRYPQNDGPLRFLDATTAPTVILRGATWDPDLGNSPKPHTLNSSFHVLFPLSLYNSIQP